MSDSLVDFVPCRNSLASSVYYSVKVLKVKAVSHAYDDPNYRIAMQLSEPEAIMAL